MHPCLNVDEILRLLACELVKSEAKATAVSLACCCKGFEDPMLDALWATQGSLLPLLKSFPGDVWNEDECTVSVLAACVLSFLNYPTRKSFKRLPTTVEWARFRKYARRMRNLELAVASNPPSPEVFSAMQLYTVNELLFPNLKTLFLWGIGRPFLPFIPLFLSPRTTSIYLSFEPDLPNTTISSTITILPTLCPDLQEIAFYFVTRDPMITATVSGMLLAANRNTLRRFEVDSPLTEEANQVICKLPNLCSLTVVTERESSLPSASLPNLIKLTVNCDNEGGWPQLFQGATLGKLESVTFFLRSEPIGDFLGTFERAALSSSVQDTLSSFCLFASYSWNPNYPSLLSFTQLVNLWIDFSCDDGCSSTVDDNIIINLSWAMPKLVTLRLGDEPCDEITTGVTAKGLLALAHNCLNLSTLCIHFQVASLSVPSATPGMFPNTESTASMTDCALTNLEVGEISMPEESALTIALTLIRLFPRIETIDGADEGWEKVQNAICNSKGIIDCSSKQHLTAS